MTHAQDIARQDSALRAIVESTDDIIGLFDADLRLVVFNQAFARYAKQTDNIVLYEGIDILEAMTNRPETAELFRGYLNRSLRGERVKEIVEYPMEDAPIFFQLTYNPIRESDQIVGVSMFVENITALKLAEKKLETYNEELEKQVHQRTLELEAKNRELTDRQRELEETLTQLKSTQDLMIESEKMVSLGILSSGVAHELNNPLNFIKNGLYNLKDYLKDQKDDERMNLFLESIRVGTERAAEIVKGLNHFSQRDQRAYKPCDIHEIIDNCLFVLQPKLRHRIIIYKDYTPDAHDFNGQEGQLHQAFLNLLTNAEQAIENRGTIDIKTEIKKNHLLIYIQDSGTGIPKKWMNRINDPFFTTKPPGKGTGLGLSITTRILQDHGGTMAHKSSIDQGTEVLVKLPVT